MSYIATGAEERGVDAAIEAAAEFGLFADDVPREELVTLVRCILDAVVSVDVLAEDLAKKHAPYLWDPEHRAEIVRYIHPDGMPDAADRIDRAIERERRETIIRVSNPVKIVREIVLGENA